MSAREPKYTIIFRPYSSPYGNPYEQLHTPPIPNAAFLDWPCMSSDSAYPDGLKSIWPMEADIIVQEHDITVSDWAYRELSSCGYPFCTMPYVLYPATTGLTHKIWSVGNFSNDGKKVEQLTLDLPDPLLERLHLGDSYPDWMDHSGLGFVKLSRPGRKGLGEPWFHASSWRNVDMAISLYMWRQNVRWHVHWTNNVNDTDGPVFGGAVRHEHE